VTTVEEVSEVLVELSVVEQRFVAVQEVLDGVPVTEVARRNGVTRQTVHRWLRRYAEAEGLAGLADRSSRPGRCPHQMPPVAEARVVELRLAHPGWGPARIVYELRRARADPVPSRSGVYRALVRHRLIDPTRRRRRRGEYRRWERSRAMELWQMDVMGGVHLADGREVKVVTGIDDYSRFVVCAKLVLRATAGPVCQALSEALARHGVPEQILTDNGKVFTARFGPGPGPVRFDRICHENGIRHLLTARYSPTTTGKVERLHKTMRTEHFALHEKEFATLAEAQAALDAWVVDYNTLRPHQAVGMRPPLERFRFAQPAVAVEVELADPSRPPGTSVAARPPGVTRWVDQRGLISLARFTYRVGPVFAGQLVEAVVDAGLVQIYHQGVLVATHAQRLRPEDGGVSPHRLRRPMARAGTSGPSVIRIADNNGNVSFAGTMYSAGRAWRHQRLDVRIVGTSVQISKDDQIVRVHAIRHDRSKEHGAYANPTGRPRKPKTGAGDPARSSQPARSGDGVKAEAAPRSA